MLASSIVKRAREHISQDPEFNTNLRTDMSIIWKGVSGLRCCHLLLTIQVKPSAKTFSHSLWGKWHSRYFIVRSAKVHETYLKGYFWNLPHYMHCLWSQILPRSCWRYAISNISAEISRKRINSSIATFVLNHGGESIKYLEISAFHHTLILPDGVHLTKLGNFHYLTTLQNVLKLFIQNGSNKFPSL